VAPPTPPRAPAERTPPVDWVLVVPVKRPELAKTRLAVPAATRARLALAMARDTVSAAGRCRPVSSVIAVCDDPAAAESLRESGADVIGDVPDAGLNPALRHGIAVAARRYPGRGVATLSADCPALRPDDLANALDIAAGHATAVVADARGTGTTLLTARPGETLVPSYGEESLRRHRDDGAALLNLPATSTLRYDVDTLEDLETALSLGVGAHTAALLRALGWPL
jgi:2-phospho-L-lactate guanylyltransferase